MVESTFALMYFAIMLCDTSSWANGSCDLVWQLPLCWQLLLFSSLTKTNCNNILGVLTYWLGDGHTLWVQCRVWPKHGPHDTLALLVLISDESFLCCPFLFHYEISCYPVGETLHSTSDGHLHLLPNIHNQATFSFLLWPFLLSLYPLQVLTLASL